MSERSGHEGWQLVPAKHEGKAGLTDQMMRSFYEAFSLNEARGDFERLNAAYNAMLGAAPTLPIAASAQADTPDEIEALFYTARNNTLAEFKKRVFAANPKAPIIADLLQVSQEALHVIRAIKPPENGNGTIVRLEEAIAKATGA